MAAPAARPIKAPAIAAALRPFLAEAVVVVVANADVETIATVSAVMMDLRNMVVPPDLVAGDFPAPITYI